MADEKQKTNDLVYPPPNDIKKISLSEIEMFCTVAVGIAEALNREYDNKAAMLRDAENPVPFKPSKYSDADRRYLRREVQRLQVKISRIGGAYSQFKRILDKAAEAARKAKVST